MSETYLLVPRNTDTPGRTAAHPERLRKMAARPRAYATLGAARGQRTKIEHDWPSFTFHIFRIVTGGTFGTAIATEFVE